jgi:hypothetical protein
VTARFLIVRLAFVSVFALSVFGETKHATIACVRLFFDYHPSSLHVYSLGLGNNITEELGLSSTRFVDNFFLFWSDI